jgi:hypothetical protein
MQRYTIFFIIASCCLYLKNTLTLHGPMNVKSCRGRYLHSTQQTQQTSMPSAEFEPAIPVIDGPQIYDLDSMTTGISQEQVYL